MSLHGSQAPGDPGVVEPKHDVFLCHSGAQKGFVWQLGKDLKSYGLHPFFDKDPDCLPIGKDFPDLICKAIEQCQVGVVFLSKEFFTVSHWPMFELVRMVECGREIMPIFLGLSPEDLSEEENVQRWKLQWQEWEKCNKRIDLLAWERAVKQLRRLSGLKYAHEAGVVAFRESIAKEIMKKVGPSYEWDDSHVQGRSRLSEVLQEKLRAGTCRRGFQVMGIYGVGGIGKTTACKSMCKDLFMNFDGRVCHVELGDTTSERDRVQDVLTRLTNINKDSLKELDECWSLLKKHLHLSKVFLAIDNVLGRGSIEEAKKYLKLGYCEGSIVMVTSRARDDLIDVNIGDGNCHEIPELEANEARSLFLQHAEPEFEVDERVLVCCIKRCHFSKGNGRSSHYHPLALKVLGSELVGVDSREWKLKLEEVDVFNQRREQKNGVFSILRRSFDDLLEEDKLLFMDVALFHIPDCYKDWKGSNSYYSSEFYNMIGRTWNIFEWLSQVHGLSPDGLKKRLDSLKRKSLLEELGDGTSQIGMHDLWREFAVMETKIGDSRGGRWVYEVVRGEAENSILSGGVWEDVRRICVMREMALHLRAVSSVKCLNFRNCSRVTVLKLVEVAVENHALDLSALKQLNSLEIFSADRSHDKKVLRVSGIGVLTNLTVLIWLGIGEASVSAVEEVSCLTNLQVLQLRGVTSLVLDLRQLRWLREVRVESSSMESILGLSSIMTDLCIVDLGSCSNLRSCPGVDDVVGLEVLYLGDCRSLEELPDLQKLTKLRALVIWGCEAVEAIPGVGSLVALQELHADGCRQLNELPDMSKLTKLEVLHLCGCELVKCIPGVGNLVALRELRVGVQMVIDVPYLGNLTQLQKVDIWGAYGGRREKDECRQEEDDSDSEESHALDLAGLESVSTLKLWYVDHELSNLSRLTALTSLDLGGCNMERLPHMGKHMRLDSLSIWDCERLREWDGVGYSAGSSASQSGVAVHCDWTLPHLRELEWRGSGWVELPDLSHFPRLRELELSNNGNTPSRHASNYGVRSLAHLVELETLKCRHSPIAELPDLSRFPRLKLVYLSECDNLTSLTISGPLTALESIELVKCSKLNALPSVDLFPIIHNLSIEGCGVDLSELEVEKLSARGLWKGKYGSWVRIRELSRDETTYHSEPDCGAGVQVALDGADEAAAGPSSRDEAPSCSDFIPYIESITECAPAPKRALERESTDVEKRFKRLKIE